MRTTAAPCSQHRPNTEPLPIVVYFHGGGFVAGGLPVVDEPARALANDVGAIVVAAGYRLASEHKFPAATDDTFAALRTYQAPRAFDSGRWQPGECSETRAQPAVDAPGRPGRREEQGQ